MYSDLLNINSNLYIKTKNTTNLLTSWHSFFPVYVAHNYCKKFYVNNVTEICHSFP